MHMHTRPPFERGQEKSSKTKFQCFSSASSVQGDFLFEQFFSAKTGTRSELECSRLFTHEKRAKVLLEFL